MPTTTASVAWSVERLSRDPGLRVQFPAGGLVVAFFPMCICTTICATFNNTYRDFKLRVLR